MTSHHTFLDQYRDIVQAWTLTRHDPATGGFSSWPGQPASIMGTTDVVWLRYASNQEDLGAPHRDRLYLLRIAPRRGLDRRTR